MSSRKLYKVNEVLDVLKEGSDPACYNNLESASNYIGDQILPAVDDVRFSRPSRLNVAF